ncbi:MAG: RHS repeat-associated core domain-containing protein, partial [Chamaesiphon sp.]|nr:RHS repeat-associated core domain-containing protein [Chamaesiphon sp.]
DKEGNRTKRTKIVGGVVDEYEWDYRNRLTKVTTKDGSGAGAVVTQIVGYEYDVDDQRVSKTVNGVVEKYIIDRNQIAYVTDASGTQTFHYLYGTNVDAVMAQDSPTGMVWSLSDRLGSVNLLTDAGGAVVDKRTFDSFGRVLSETNPSVKFRYGYTGREQDKETGLDYYRARYYDAANGRFISVDPAGFGAGDTNLYRYVGNSSTMYTDPTGEFAFLVPLAWAAGAAVSAGLTAAAFGGVYGFARGAAESIDSDRRNGILSGDSIGSAYINGLIGGVQGAGIGFGVGFGATSLGLGAVALGVPGAVVGGIGTTLGAVGVGGGVISAGVNFSQGNIATGVVDLASSIYGGTKLWSGYQAAKQQAFDNGFNNARQVYPEGNPQLNSTGQIVTAQSSALATTPPGWSLLPASSGSAAEETSTIFRVQGGTPPYASRNHISFDSDGNPLINKTTLNISIGDLKHAEYFLGKRPGARIFSFEIPKWMDEFIQSEAIPQLNYNSNPANQNKLAPKIVDETTPGRSYELPSIWAKWLEETAIKGSGKITDKKN